MSINKKIVKVETVTEEFCDICGDMVGDGLHDGTGGTNFWGKFVSLKKLAGQAFTIEPQYESDYLNIRVREKWDSLVSYTVCRKCADKVISFIENSKL